MITKSLRLVYKPPFVQWVTPSGQSSIWAARYRAARAAYPGLIGDEQSPIVRRRFHPCLALLPAGVAWPFTLLQMPVVSYTTISP